MKLSLAVPDVVRYLDREIHRDSPLKRELREETARLPRGGMLLEPDTGALLGLLARITAARRVLEIGTFTGYSALCLAEALPPEGRLICCDVSAEFTDMARRYWARAGVADRIELRLAPALDTLAALEATAEAAPFDMAFIDADKANGVAYYDACVRFLRPGGVIAMDNALWDGRVADPLVTDDDTVALRRLNAHVLADARVDASLLTIGDGLLLAVKRPAAVHG